MNARWCEDTMLLHQPGDYTIDKEAGVTSKTVIVCPSCLTHCRSSVGVVSEQPLTLSNSFLCAHCYTDYSVYDGKIEPMAGTLPPWVRWETSHQFDDYKYR